MQIIFLLVGILGLVMFFLGMKTLIKIYFNQAIAELNLSENLTEKNFEKIGTYSLCFVGGYVNNKGNFDLYISNNGMQLDVYEKQMKFRFKHKGQLATEFYQFEVESIGKHKFEFKNIADLEIKKSMLLLKRIFQNQVTNNNVEIVIRETSKTSNFIISLLMAVFGFNIAGWGFILAVNPYILT